MAARMTVSKKRKKVSATRKKAASRRLVSRKKTAGKKRTVSKKRPSAKKSSKKKVIARKKPATKKKKTSKKQVTKKKASKKKVVKKKTLKKKAASKKRIIKKKLAARKAPGKKKSVAKKRPIRTKAPVRRARRRSDLLSGPIHGVSPYAVRRGEQYMSNGQLEHFEDILAAWKHELMNEVDRTVHHMQDEAANFPDPNDRATQESEFGLELRTRDRERKLLRKIDSALSRVEDGSYGFCEETGEEIGLQRLEARPVATLCVEAQERREMAERQFRDRDDRYR
ncbi:MAG: RNA polymerase-binding protein DksA [Woeseiaceae bacterium]